MLKLSSHPSEYSPYLSIPFAIPYWRSPVLLPFSWPPFIQAHSSSIAFQYKSPETHYFTFSCSKTYYYSPHEVHTMVFNAFHILVPSYLSKSISHHNPTSHRKVCLIVHLQKMLSACVRTIISWDAPLLSSFHAILVTLLRSSIPLLIMEYIIQTTVYIQVPKFRKRTLTRPEKSLTWQPPMHPRPTVPYF